MSLSGKLAYQLWYRPACYIQDLCKEGGPIIRRRNERGRADMEIAARTLPLLPAAPGAPLALHLLTGRRFWYQTAFCLWTFARHANRPLAPVIYDDGTLTEEFRAPLARLFPAARFVSQKETIARLDELLPVAKFPVLRERWLNYPNIRKLTDVHIGGKGAKLVIDSDLLFFHRPDLLIHWLEHPRNPLHAVDCETAYGYPLDEMSVLAGAPVAPLVNVGLTGLVSEDIDWTRLEFMSRSLIEKHGTHYYLEQALIAMLVAGRDCTIAPAADYVTGPVLPEALERRAVMHHYVAQSKRWYFQNNWRHVRETSSLILP